MGKAKQWLKKKLKRENKERRLINKEITWEWDFKVWSPADYELKLVFPADNKLFLTIFQAAIERLKKKNVDLDADPELVDNFDLEERFFNLVRTYLKKPFSITARDVLLEHKFKLLDYYVVKGWFDRDEAKNWKIHIILKGTHTDKR